MRVVSYTKGAIVESRIESERGEGERCEKADSRERWRLPVRSGWRGRFGSGGALAAGEVTISHYFTGELGRAGLEEIFGNFREATGVTVKDSPIGHEDFKTGILVRGRPGATCPTSSAIGPAPAPSSSPTAGNLGAIDEMWAARGLDAVVAKSVADGATMYNGARYLVPFGYHYAGMFYNTKVMAEARSDRIPPPPGRDS